MVKFLSFLPGLVFSSHTASLTTTPVVTTDSSSGTEISTVLNIEYMINPGAVEILSAFISDISWIDEMIQHGCWCARFNPNLGWSNSAALGLGGKTPVDDLDMICKKWAMSRGCTRMTGNSCENYSQTTGLFEYQLQFLTGINDAFCPDSDLCLSETCQVDLFYSKEILEWKNSNNLTAVTSPSCDLPGGPGARSNLFCNSNPVSLTTTQLPTTTDEDLGVIDQILIDQGIDNSNKEVAVTLAWDRVCDLDVHVFEPSGFEIAWYNSVSPNTGSLDIDAGSPGNEAFAIENVSWTSPPTGCYRVAVRNYGSCSPGVDYKLFIRVDGVTTVYNRQAPAGDNTMYEIANFCWSPSSRLGFLPERDIHTGYEKELQNDNRLKN